jgi:carbonic anhydrase
MSTPVQMGAAQIEAFRRLLRHNNRPTQPLNGRLVATDTAGLQ